MARFYCHKCDSNLIMTGMVARPNKHAKELNDRYCIFTCEKCNYSIEVLA